MNTLPEWFTVVADKTDIVRDLAGGSATSCTGKRPHNGLPIQLRAGREKVLLVKWPGESGRATRAIPGVIERDEILPGSVTT